MPDSEIRGGIEFTRYPDHPETGVSCARCGSSADFRPCDYCGGEGWNWAEEVDPDPMWYDEGESIPCPDCGSTGGSWHCVSSRDWCEAHPLEGREEVESTAFGRAEEWE